MPGRVHRLTAVGIVAMAALGAPAGAPPKSAARSSSHLTSSSSFSERSAGRLTGVSRLVRRRLLRV